MKDATPTYKSETVEMLQINLEDSTSLWNVIFFLII
jgi:hypothetical protein